MLTIDWTQAPEWANFAAMDCDGKWWWFEDAPIDCGDGFWRNGKETRLILIDYEKTLSKRPPIPSNPKQYGQLMMQWQKIETAPKYDGSLILAYSDGEQARMRWLVTPDGDLWVWDDEALQDADPDPIQPTHWMPLPPPPAD